MSEPTDNGGAPVSGHLAEQLPLLLTGEASQPEVHAAGEHLRGCEDCRQELVTAVCAHAALTSAARFAPDVMSLDLPRHAEALRNVPAHGDLTDSAPSDSAVDADPTPDLSAVFARIDAEAKRPAAAPARHGRRRWVVGGVAAVAAAAVVTAVVVEQPGSAPSGRQIALQAFDVGTHKASATVSGTQMRVDAATLPRLGTSKFYEVWLTNQSRTQLQPIGSMSADNRGVFTVPASVMSHYTDIEVSVQHLGQTGYSGTSVLRGSYG